jgi:hypothetical protein
MQLNFKYLEMAMAYRSYRIQGMYCPSDQRVLFCPFQVKLSKTEIKTITVFLDIIRRSAFI